MSDREADDRRDMFIFLGFLSLCGTTVSIVVIAKNVWRPDQWAAFGALSAFLQAVAVVAALPYAAKQIREARSAASKRRSDDLVDRLEVASRRYSKAVRRADLDWFMLRYIALEYRAEYASAFSSEAEFERTQAARYDERRLQLREACDDATDYQEDALRLLVALGKRRTMLYARLLIRGSVNVMSQPPVRVDEFPANASETPFVDAKAVGEELRKFVDSQLELHAPVTQP